KKETQCHEYGMKKKNVIILIFNTPPSRFVRWLLGQKLYNRILSSYLYDASRCCVVKKHSQIFLQETSQLPV
ncbi:MAG: hypothetical protein JXR53_15785, partial [Bacteroidales bacterium]|nr:hypothetical protein [Bacteroidales bacterium]